MEGHKQAKIGQARKMGWAIKGLQKVYQLTYQLKKDKDTDTDNDHELVGIFRVLLTDGLWWYWYWPRPHQGSGEAGIAGLGPQFLRLATDNNITYHLYYRYMDDTANGTEAIHARKRGESGKQDEHFLSVLLSCAWQRKQKYVDSLFDQI